MQLFAPPPPCAKAKPHVRQRDAIQPSGAPRAPGPRASPPRRFPCQELAAAGDRGSPEPRGEKRGQPACRFAEPLKGEERLRGCRDELYTCVYVYTYIQESTGAGARAAGTGEFPPGQGVQGSRLGKGRTEPGEPMRRASWQLWLFQTRQCHMCLTRSQLLRGTAGNWE